MNPHTRVKVPLVAGVDWIRRVVLAVLAHV